MKNSYNASVRCAITLAGGEGQRLRPFIQRLRGDTLPKQYANFIGTRSMLEHTYHRVEKLIAPERLFTVVTKGHLNYFSVYRQLWSRPRETVIIQPENKDTRPRQRFGSSAYYETLMLFHQALQPRVDVQAVCLDCATGFQMVLHKFSDGDRIKCLHHLHLPSSQTRQITSQRW